MRRLSLLVIVIAVAGCGKAPGPGSLVRIHNVKLPTAEGEAWAAEHAPDHEDGLPVLLLPGDYGATPEVYGFAGRLAHRGHFVLVLDLYRGKLATDVEEAHILSRAIPEEQIKADLKAAVDRLARRGGKVAVVGWELGGGYALDLAIADPRVTACVGCYGRLTTDPEALAKMQATYLGIFAEQDKGNSPETRRDFEEAMRQAKREVAGLHVFAGCDGGFMTPGRDRKPGPNDADAAEKAWGLIEAFLRERSGSQP